MGVLGTLALVTTLWLPGGVVWAQVAPTLSINDVTVTEGDSGTTTAGFTITLFPASADVVTVDFATANQSAVGPEDYGLQAGTLTFAPGVTSQSVGITVNGDSLQENTETFSVNLSNAVGAILSDAVGTGTILDDDVTPSISINDVTVTEGGNARFKVSLFPASSEVVTVAFNTANGTAVAPDDYGNKAGLLTFEPGDRQETITVDTHDGDGDIEDTETFTVQLFDATNARIADATGQGIILDDDVTPSLTINDVEVIEGDRGTTEAIFRVTLFPESDERVTVEFATANGSAVSPEDYGNEAGLLVFDPGATNKRVVVEVVADDIDEQPEGQTVFISPGVRLDTTGSQETFTVTLFNPVNARLADNIGVGTIIDDDLTPGLVIDDVIVTEGDVGTTDAVFTVSLFPSAGEDVTVEFSTGSGSATAPEDFRFTSGTLTFRPGERDKTVRIPVKGDVLDEPDEFFTVNLTTPANATVLDSQGTALIVDDDLGPALSVTDATVLEGTTGGKEAVFSVSLTEPSDRVVSVDVTTVDDLATTPEDYVATKGPLSFATGETRIEVRVPIVSDALEEPDETFLLRLSNATVAVADVEGVGIIVDDDAPAAPRVSLVPTPTDRGYWLAAADGDVFSFGDASFLGSVGLTNARSVPPGRLNRPIVDMATTPTGRGYWLVASDGGVFAFGAARFLGSTGNVRLNQPIVGMAPTPSGFGYWLVASDGGIFAFGDAGFFGSTGSISLNHPIVSIAPTPSGRGYWLVASDGGVFTFGDARFFGSTGGRPINRPMVGMAASPTGQGYWLVASDGGVFTFGDATFLGSTGAIRLLRPITGMAATSNGRGYWLVAEDGGVFAFGEATFFGSTGGVRPPPTSAPVRPR